MRIGVPLLEYGDCFNTIYPYKIKVWYKLLLYGTGYHVQCNPEEMGLHNQISSNGINTNQNDLVYKKKSHKTVLLKQTASTHQTKQTSRV